MTHCGTKKANSHLIEHFLPFYYCLSAYRLGPISLEAIGLIIIAIMVYFKRRGKIRISASYSLFFVFLCYAILRDIIKIVSGVNPIQTQLNRILEYTVIFFLVFTVCSCHFNEIELYKTWKIAGGIYIAGLLYHIVQIYFMGNTVSPISLIPGYALRKVGVAVQRPHSFFTEPASFVTAMMPLIFLALKRGDIKWAVISTIAVLASTSTVGIILSAVLWGIFLTGEKVSMRTKIVILLAIIGFFIVFANLDVFSSSISKLILVLQGGSTFGSRIECGLEILKTQSFTEVIFGTNYNEVMTYVSANFCKFSEGSIAVLYYQAGGIFLNTFVQIIFRYGLIGLLLFSFPIIKFILSTGYEAKPYIVMICVGIFGQGMLLNSSYFMMVLILLLYASCQMEKRRCEYGSGLQTADRSKVLI